MTTNIVHNAPATFPSSVIIAGEAFPLYYTISPRHSSSWAYVLVDGVPTATIDLYRGDIYKHSVDCAERVLNSYQENDKKWLAYYPKAFGVFDSIGVDTPSPEDAYDNVNAEFTLSMIDEPSFSVDVYKTDIKHDENNRSKTHSHVTLFVSNENDAHFVIYDKALIKEVIARYNKRVHTTRRITSDTHHISAELTGEA